MTLGAFLIGLGIVFLLDNLGYIKEGIGGLILPLLLIAFGISLAIKGLS